MFDKEKLTKRDKYYKNEIGKRTIVKKCVTGLKCAYLGITMLCGLVPFAEGVDLIRANHQYNTAIDLYNAGDIQASEAKISGMSKYIDGQKKKSTFSKMSYEEKLAYIEKLLSDWARRENTAINAGMMGMLATILLSRATDLLEEYEDYELDKVLYELYLDEKSNPKFKEKYNRLLSSAIEGVSEDPEYSKEQAEEKVASRFYADDKDYKLGFQNGQYDFYSRCNYGSGNIYNKALVYFEKGLSAEQIDKKLVEVSYKKGYYRSAGLYVAEKFASCEELTEEEQSIFSNMDNLSLNNIMHLDRYNATEVKNRKDYWHGYVEGFKNEVTSPYSSIDFDLSGLSKDVKCTIDDALDTNSYKEAFYRGVQDGMEDLRNRAIKMASVKEQNV